jgi:hypothetical protein
MMARMTRAACCAALPLAFLTLSLSAVARAQDSSGTGSGTTTPAAAHAPPSSGTTTPPAAHPASTYNSAKLSAARALYYTPTTKGLQSFHCAVDFDWKDMLTRYSGGAVPDDNPFLQYLRSVHLGITDDLKGSGQLDWTTAGSPPAGQEDSAAKMKDGMQQMMAGFFSSWNAYMNGNMVPAPDATTTVTETPDGMRMHASATDTDVTELFDKNMLLTQAHVVQSTSDVYAYPTYIDTPDGRVVSAIRTVFRQPPTASPGELTLNISYAPVQSFRLPQTLNYELKNIGSFAFKFSACSVQTTAKAPDKL